MVLLFRGLSMYDELRTQGLLKNIRKYCNEAKKEYKALNSSDEFIANMAYKALGIDIIQIGENVNKLLKVYPDIKKSEPGIKWTDIVGMRNLVVHDYDGVNRNEIIEVAEKDIPELHKAVNRVMKKVQNW